MILGAALLACAIGVAPTTMDAITGVESHWNPLALHVNGWTGAQPQAHDAAEAVVLARGFIARGYSVDIGVAQVNSRNLPRLGYTVEQIIVPCTNLAAGARILQGYYAQAVQQFGEGQRALMSALSGYNTGSLWRGFANGYVAKYYINAPLDVSVNHREFAVAAPLPTVKKREITMVAYDRPGYSLEIR